MFLALALLASALATAPRAAAQEEPDGSDESPETLPDEPEAPVDPRTVLPAGANSIDGPGGVAREAEPPVVDRTNDEAARPGLVGAVFEADVVGARGEVGGLAGPIKVDVDAGVTAGSTAIVEVLEPGLAQQVSPVDAAAIIDFEDSNGERTAGRAVFDAELDLSDVAVTGGASALERLQLVWYSGCSIVNGEVRCQDASLLDTTVDSAGRTLSATVDLAALHAAVQRRVDVLVADGVARSVAEAPVLAAGHSLRDVLESPAREGDDIVVGEEQLFESAATAVVPDETVPPVERVAPVTVTPPVVEPTAAPEETAAPTETVAPEETVVPEETAPPTETTVPEETVVPTETTVPEETAVPEETVAPTGTTVPETTVPEETVAPTETTVPDSVAPEGTVAREVVSGAGLLPVAPSDVGGFGVLAATSGSGGASGDFAASPYAVLQDFQVGLFTGAAETGYPIPVPAAAAGPAPDVRFGYSSAGVDGMNTSTNNQPGPIGVGWSLSEPAITREIGGGCRSEAFGDSCYSEFFSIQLNGTSSRLEEMKSGSYVLAHAPDGSKYGNPVGVAVTEFRPVDAGIQWRVLRFTSNAAQGGVADTPEWWLVVTPDGTLYEFGRDERSIDWAPLYYDAVEYPVLPAGCDYASSRLCTMGYKWNLEKVIDLRDNQVRYERAQELNWYRARGSAFYDEYIRASRPVAIRYTFNPSVTGQTDPNARVLFNWEWRCGDSEDFGSCDGVNDWPNEFYDTPTDLVCRVGDSSCPVGNQSPTFFSELRLGSVQTQIYQSTFASNSSNSGAWDDRRDWDTVATFDLRQAMPDPDDFSWFNSYTDPDDSEAKTALYSVTQRIGGGYEAYGYTTIQAEQYDAEAGISAWNNFDLNVSTPDVGGGWAAGNYNNNDWTRYDDVYLGDLSSDARTVWVRVRSGVNRAGTVQVRLGSATGTILGSVAVDTAGSWETKKINIANNVASGVQNIVVKVVGTDPSLRVNWFRFQPGSGSNSNWGNLPSLDPTSFTTGTNLFEWLPNRVNAPAGVSPMVMPRIKKAINPVGGHVTFTYSQPSALRCGGDVWSTTFVLPTVTDNNTLCSPGYDSFTGAGGFVWWHKWVVTSARWDGPFANNKGRVEDYAYGTPWWGFGEGQAAQADPSLCAGLTWTSFRGFDQVTVTNKSDDPTPEVYGKTVTDFFQGMHADPNNYGTSANCVPTSTKTVTRTFGSGATTSDYFWRAGQVMQVSVLDPAGVELSRTENRMDQLNRTSGQSGTAGSIYDRRYSFSDRTQNYLLDGTGSKATVTRYTHSPSYDSSNRLNYVLVDATEFQGEVGVGDSRWVDLNFNVDVTKWILGKVTLNSTYGAAQPTTSPLLTKIGTIYNSVGEPTAVRVFNTSGSFVETDLIYDTQGRVTQSRNDANQVTSTISYDPIHGYAETTKNGLDHLTTTVFDFLARPDKVTDPNLNVTEAGYDGFNRVVDVWLPGDPTTGPSSTEYIYGESAGVKTVKTRSLFDKSPLSYVESVVYIDGFARPVQTDVVSPANTARRTVTNIQYDGAGRVRQTAAAYENTAAIGAGPISLNWDSVINYQRNTFDGLGRPTRIAQRSMTNLLWRTDLTYDLWTTSVTDPNGDISDSTVDAFGNLVEVNETNGAATYTTSYNYDRANRLTSIIDDAANTTTVGYDVAGRKTSLNDPDSGIWVYSYTGEGELLTQNGPTSNDDLWFSYDILGRPTVTRRTNSTGQVQKALSYDTREKGFVFQEKAYSTGAFVTTASYDRDNRYRMIAVDRYLLDKDANPQRIGLDFTFGDGGQLESVSYPENLANYGTGETVSYSYDNVTGLAETAVSDTTTFNVSNLDYDYAGRTESTEFTSGWLHEERWYETSTGRVAAIRASGGANLGGWYQNLSWEYDNVGNVTSTFDVRNPYSWTSRQSLCNEYDDLDRLTRSYSQQTTAGSAVCTGTPSMTAGGISADAGTGFDREYSYDSIGNITKLEETYNDPTTTGDDRFVRSYNYGAGTAGPHAVTSVTDPNNPNFAYSYDQAGQMTSRNVGNGVQTITYDPLGQTDSLTDNGVVTKFRYDSNGIRARQQVGTVDTLYAGQWWEQTGTDITKYYFVNGELTGLSDDGDVRYVFKDQLGGVANTLNLDAGGLGHLRNRFHPFGEPRDTLEVTETDLGFTGQRRDGSGLMYYNARYYDPLTARFTQADTIIPDFANPQDLNRYTYVGNNPATFNDPTGRCFDLCPPTVGRQDDGRPVAERPWWDKVPVANNAIEITRLNELYPLTVWGPVLGPNIPGQALELIFLQESGYWLYGVDEIVNSAGRDSYGPMSMQLPAVVDVFESRGLQPPSETDIIDALTGSSNSSYLYATLYISDQVAEFGLDADATEAEFRTFMAYALGPPTINTLNVIDWDFNRLSETPGLPIDAIVERASYYEYWVDYLDAGPYG